MDFSKELILSFLDKVFDEPKKRFEDTIDFEYNCNSDKCKHDVNKFNLTYNINKNIFNCWKCGYRGNLYKLLKKHGNKDDYELLSSIIHDLKHEAPIQEFNEEKKILEFPESFQFLDEAPESFHKKNAIKYLDGRGIGLSEIKKYKIGFTTKGKYKFRIIVPSYDKNGKLNYFDGRAFYPNIKPTYLKPDAEIVKKSEIIFNEQNVSFDVPIFLVEGVFDMFPIYNVIPLLGKRINMELLNKIIKHKTPVVICIDEDAISDVVGMFYFLNSFNIDVYWCPIKDDLGEIYEKQGKTGVINTLNKTKKIGLKTIMELKMFLSENKGEDLEMSKEEFKEEWELIKKTSNINHGK
jgi:hypothetical protein